MTLSAATAAAVARSLNTAAVGQLPSAGMRERLVEANMAAAGREERRRDTFSSLAMELTDGDSIREEEEFDNF
jgi:hypothetical protein